MENSSGLQVIVNPLRRAQSTIDSHELNDAYCNSVESMALSVRVYGTS